MYIRLTNEEYPIYLGTIKAENPLVSFSKEPDDAVLQPLGYANVFTTIKPVYDTDTQKIMEGAPTNDGNQWNQVWDVINLTQLELDTNFSRAAAIKKAESDAYAEDLIEAAYSNPSVGVTENPGTYKKIVAARERNNANKLAGEIALAQDEKDQAKVDQKLSEYDGKVTVANDKSYTEIDKKSYVSEVEALVIETITTWPTWVAV